MSTESGRRIGIKDLINEPDSEQFHYYQGPNQFSQYSLSPPHLPSPLPQQRLMATLSPQLPSPLPQQPQQNLMPTLSPPQLPSPLPQQPQQNLMPTLSPPQLPSPLPQQRQQNLMPTPSMELDSYRFPTPLASPTSPVTSPSLAPIQSYSPSNTSASTPSITSKSGVQYLYKRRERNKVAAAKYRTKKHIEHQNMSKTIDGLTEANMFLLEHLEEIKAENLELREMVDTLESELMLGGANLPLSPTSTIDDEVEITSNSNTIGKNKTKRGRFRGRAKGTGPSVKGARKYKFINN